MAKFNPALLVPAHVAPEFARKGNKRTVKDVLLDNIGKQKHLFSNPEDDGKRHFKFAGNTVAFTLRVSNSALVLGQYESEGVKADVKEMTVPKANFIEALDYFADKVKAGEFDAQLEGLSVKRDARAAKASETRANKKTA